VVRGLETVQRCPRIVGCMRLPVPRTNPFGRLVRCMILFCCAGPVALLALPAAPLAAQRTAQRVVQGKVVDKSDAGMKGATVYLKDGHTLSVKSYIASDDGSYRFGQLVQNTDYQLWAEHDGKKSAVKNISSFDTRNEFNITLKIEK
jgi:hypothetical protein